MKRVSSVYALFCFVASVTSVTMRMSAMNDASGAAADVNGGVEIENTNSLHGAVQKGDSALVTQLLEQGADPNEEDEDGHTPLWYVGEQLRTAKSVVTKERLAIVQMLYPHVTSVADSDGALLASCKSEPGDMRGVVRALCLGARLEGKDLLGNSPLFIACKLGQVKIAQLLLDLKAQVDAKNEQDCTALHQAHVSTVPLLLDDWADINAQDRYGNTPLHRAVLYPKQIHKIKLLLKHDASVEILNKQGETPLVFARRRFDKNVPNSEYSRIVALLKSHGAQEEESCILL